MRRFVAFSAAIAVSVGLSISGCSDTSLAIELCEIAVKGQLKSPSTFQRISATDDRGIVLILFDAANAYGTPIRNSAKCSFNERDPKKAASLIDFEMNGERSSLSLLAAQVAVSGEILRRLR